MMLRPASPSETPPLAMKSSFLAASFVAFCACGAIAQDDRVVLTSGSKLEGVKVVSFDVRALRYSRAGNTETVSTDQVLQVDLGKFRDTYARGLRDADMMVTIAREQVTDKNLLMAQFGFTGAAAQFFDNDEASKAVAALDELQKSCPEAGVLPEVYRQKFEYYMGLGSKKAADAATVAKKYKADAVGGAWPNGLATEAEFFLVMAERMGGGNPKEFQTKLQGIVASAGGVNPMVQNRANIQLANSLREAKDNEGAQRIYEDLSKRDGVDTSSRAGAFLGLGQILLEKATPETKDVAKQALLLFLRVRLETKDAWPSLQAEALYHAILAADKWRGTEYQTIMARCRGVLFADFPQSEWTKRAKQGG